MEATQETATLQPPPPPTPESPRRPARNWLAVVALVVAIVSLLINVALIYVLLRAGDFGLRALNRVRETALTNIDDGLNFVNDIQKSGITFNFPISQTLPINQEIPIQADLVIPVRATVPIKTSVNVTIDLGSLGTRDVQIPINTTVPVSVAVPVNLNHTFNINTLLNVRLTVPIRIKADQPPLQDWLKLARDKLTGLRSQVVELFQQIDRFTPQSILR